jgi:hypothetical protein
VEHGPASGQLNAICPYYTMFPLEYPLGIMSKYRRRSPIVLDPFRGRGTMLYAARKLGINAFGLDTSPVAAAIAQAKLASAALDDVMGWGEELVSQSPRDVPDNTFFRSAFANSTLVKLCSLRAGLLKARPSN